MRIITFTRLIVGFSEIPSNITLLIGSDEEAIFRCSHESVGVDVAWLINGTFIQNVQLPDVVIAFVNENGTKVHTLSIPARSEYNGTEVVCIANFVDALPERSPSVILILMEGWSYVYILSCQ